MLCCFPLVFSANESVGGIAVDPAEKKLYFASGRHVKVVSRDGSVRTIIHSRGTPQGLTVDLQNR